MAYHARSPVPCLQILRLPQVCKVTGLGRSMIYQLESASRFPCRVRIGARAVGWVEAEVQGWLAERVERFRAGDAVVRRPPRPRSNPAAGSRTRPRQKKPLISNILIYK